MAKIPAICKNCGLMFPSDFDALPGMRVQDCASDCPRCRKMAPVLNGYVAMINGIVTFITAPENTREEKQALIDAAKSVASGKVKVTDAIQDLGGTSTKGGMLLRDWVTVGSLFVSAMATVGMFLLDYIDNRGNEPPERLATEVVDKFLRSEPQPDRRVRRAQLTSWDCPEFCALAW